MRGLADNTAFSSHADRGTRIIPSDHSARDMSSPKDVNCVRSVRLELVLEDNETEESKPALGLFPVRGARSVCCLTQTAIQRTASFSELSAMTTPRRFSLQ